MVLANNLTITPSAGTTLFISGNVSQSSAPETLKLCGPGTLVLSGTNSYTGGTFVTEGTLEVLNPAAIPCGSSLMVGESAALAFDEAASQWSPGETASAASTSPVPEPGTIGLFLFGGSVMLFPRLRLGARGFITPRTFRRERDQFRAIGPPKDES